MTAGGDFRNAGVLYTVPAQGGAPHVFLAPDSTNGELGLIYPHVLPDGASLLLSVNTDSAGTIVYQSGDTRTALARHPGEVLAFPAYAPSGHILYQRGFQPASGGIWAAPFDLSSGRATGQPFLVADGQAMPSVSRDGTLLYRSAAGVMRRLVWVDRTGAVLDTIGQPQRGMGEIRLSPDGRRVAISSTEQSNNGDIWIYDAVTGARSRLTFDPAYDFSPVWSPAGDTLAFYSLRSGGGDIYVQAADGNSTARLLAADARLMVLSSWSRDGKYLLFTILFATSAVGLWYMPMTGERTPAQFHKASLNEYMPAFSPDGRYVAYTSDESGRNEIYVTRFPSGEGKRQVSVNGGQYARWSPRGDEIFFVEGDNRMMAAPVRTVPSFQPGTPQPLFTGMPLLFNVNSLYDVSADGRRFVVAAPVAGASAAPVMTVVENWAAEFEEP